MLASDTLVHSRVSREFGPAFQRNVRFHTSTPSFPHSRQRADVLFKLASSRLSRGCDSR